MALNRIIKGAFSLLGLKVSRSTRKAVYFRKMYRKISGIEGDVVECGVGRMISFQILADLLRDEGSDRKLWGFDSFEGFPEPTAEDTSPRNPQAGEWSYLKPEDVAKFLFVSGFKKNWIQSHIEVVKGFFQDSLPKNTLSKIALLHLDVDLYDSYRTCLKHLFPKVVPGGVVLFDEYANRTDETKFPGARKAIDEYFAGTPHRLSRDGATGKFYLVKS